MAEDDVVVVRARLKSAYEAQVLNDAEQTPEAIALERAAKPAEPFISDVPHDITERFHVFMRRMTEHLG